MYVSVWIDDWLNRCGTWARRHPDLNKRPDYIPSADPKAHPISLIVDILKSGTDNRLQAVYKPPIRIRMNYKHPADF